MEWFARSDRTRTAVAKRVCRTALLTVLGVPLALHGQATVTEAQNPLSVPARQWAAEAAARELKVIDYGNSYLRYRMHSRDAKGDHVRDVIETRDGAVARLILMEGRALTPEEDADERNRLQAMIDSPSAYARHVKNEASGRKLALDMVKLLPDAMLYTYAPGQPQRASRIAGAGDPPEIVIDYQPNPSWTPPGITAEALTGLEGRVWIDSRTHHMTRMEGTVFRSVNFGFGVLAHIAQGGKLTFEQTRVSEQRWIFSRFTERLNVRVLVKTLREDSDIEGYDFSEVPGMPYQDAVRLLLAAPLPAR